MRRLGLLAAFVLLLIVGGAISSYFIAEGTEGVIPGLLVNTQVPEGAVTAFGQNQGLYFVLMVGFIIINLVGASLTFAFLFWFLNREAETAKKYKPETGQELSTE